MVERDSQINESDATELAEALWNRTSLRALGAIGTALKVSASKRLARSSGYERYVADLALCGGNRRPDAPKTWR
jgi:hypothetical protein